MKRICSVFGGHLLSINFPHRKWEGYYAYSSIVGEKLCLPLLCLIIYVIWCMINFALRFMRGKAHGWGTFPKCEATLDYCLVLGPLFWKCPHPRDLHYTKKKNLLEMEPSQSLNSCDSLQFPECTAFPSALPGPSTGATRTWNSGRRWLRACTCGLHLTVCWGGIIMLYLTLWSSVLR